MNLVDDLIAIALGAGKQILTVYERDFSVRLKRDASPVTEADEAAEAYIVSELSRIAPDIPIVAEEATAAGVVPATSEQFFLVDPLDGSKEFISRNGEFTVNIALIRAGVPVVGVVYAPALGRIWWGDLEGRAKQGRVADGEVIEARKIAVRLAPSEGLDVVGSRSHCGAETHAWLQQYNVAGFVPAGSSLKFCLVASGEADLYPRMGRTMEWDTAAGDAVLRAAGGKVVTLLGDHLSYGKRNQADDIDFANPQFVAIGDPALGWLP